MNWLKQKIIKSQKHQSSAQKEINFLPFVKRCDKEVLLENGEKLIEFVSCSYLGLDQDARIINAVSNDLHDVGFSFPAARTRIYSQKLDILETLLNEIFFNNFTVLFQNLHSCHQGVIPLLGSGEMPGYPIKPKGVTFVVDRHAHSSIQINRSLMEQFGNVIVVDITKENDFKTVIEQISNRDTTPILFCDSIGSMGGEADIIKLYEQIREYDGYLYIDDAHGMSIHGTNGSGAVLKHFDNTLPVGIILTTSLAKGFGTCGGIIVVPLKSSMEFIKRFCPTYIFGGPPVIPIINASIVAAEIHLSSEIIALQKQLWNNLELFDELVSEDIVNYGQELPLRGKLLGNEFDAIDMGKKLRAEGIAVTVAMYPTVELHNPMIRCAFSAKHTTKQIRQLAGNLLNSKV